MNQLRPEKVYVTGEVYERPECVARLERMLACIECEAVETVREDAALDELSAERGWTRIPKWGTITERRDPDIVFTTAKFHGEEQQQERRERYPNLRARDLLGYHTCWFRPDGEPEWRRAKKGIVCQSAYQLHSIMGCPFRCHYCGLGGMIRILLNMEEYCEHLDEWLALWPEQRLYKWDNQTDVLCFEPEYGASELLVGYFAQREHQYLEIYAGKSDNVDFLLDLDHQGHTILQWSIAARTQTEVFEDKTASMEARIEAARKCQQAGYLVRFRFSPIIPVKNWREENAELIRLIFARTKPDVISLCAFGWMDVDDARACLDFSLLDHEYVAAMEAAAPFVRERGYTIGGGRPMPHDARAVMFDFLIDTIRSVSPDTVVALCLETEEMWRAFEGRLGMTPEHYVCNCGPMCTPEGRLYDKMVGMPA
jgi:spore photoproduct lyase